MKFGFGSTPEKNGIPRIDRVSPCRCTARRRNHHLRKFLYVQTRRAAGGAIWRNRSPVALASNSRLIARVPENVTARTVQVVNSQHESQPYPVALAYQIADNLHPVANPAVDAQGNIYVTFSGPRGQRVPVSLYKIGANYAVKPYVTSLINPTGLAVGPSGDLFVSCRHDGTIHRVTPGWPNRRMD